MCHKQQMEFCTEVAKTHPEFFRGTRVLEVGSLNINGTVRDLFVGCTYLGIDIGPGNGVDRVIGGHELDEPDGSFDVACSTECFEHNPHWQETFANMLRMTRPGGLVFFTCAGAGRQEHGTAENLPQDSPHTAARWPDYYRNLDREDFRQAFDLAGLFQWWEFSENAGTCDLYFAGVKR